MPTTPRAPRQRRGLPRPAVEHVVGHVVERAHDREGVVLPQQPCRVAGEAVVLESGRVEPDAVQVAADEHHRHGCRHGIEQRAVGGSGHSPSRKPKPTTSRRAGGDALADERHHLGGGGRGWTGRGDGRSAPTG